MTKIFVATLVLQLVADGLLELDGEAAPFAQGITVRQLLNHTSGLPDFVGVLHRRIPPGRQPDPARRHRAGRRQRRQRSPCGSAWGHIGFAIGYTAFCLSSENGERQVVLCADGLHGDQPAEDAFLDAAGALAWSLYCA